MDKTGKIPAETPDPQQEAGRHFAQGCAHHAAQRLAEALAHYDRTLALAPDYAEAWANRALALRGLGQAEAARDSLLRAIQAAPHMPGLYFNLGNLLRDDGDMRGAAVHYRKAADVLAQGGRVPDARLYCSIANNLGRAIMESGGDLAEAEQWLRRACDADPRDANALNNLGTCLCHKGAFAEAVDCFRQASAVRPDHRNALANLGGALRAAGRPAEAIEAFRKTLELYPDFAEAHANFAMALLNDGQFAEGFRENEWRLRLPTQGLRDIFRQPQWMGEDIAGKRLLIHAEQGLGDTIQFCRYAAMAARRGAEVILEAQPSLLRLLRSLDGVGQVIAQGEARPDFDLHCPVMSLPLAFGTLVETIPADIPYLAPDAATLQRWKKRVPAEPGLRKVGLVWAGNPRQGVYDHAALARRRNIAPDLLGPLFAPRGLRFYSLQKNAPPPPASFGLVDLMHECADFADTAGLVAQLDLVISVDTSVAHLAGAMGKPVWMLDRNDMDWRWLPGRADSPWYPSMRIFRQAQPGAWEPVIADVARALVEEARKR